MCYNCFAVSAQLFCACAGAAAHRQRQASAFWKSGRQLTKRIRQGGNNLVRDIMKDPAFLAQKAAPAVAQDTGIGQDLRDTLAAHREDCVGMAANMIGVNKRIIVFDEDGVYRVLYNPVILKKSGGYEAEEGCLSLPGTRKTKRYKSIKVQYENENFQRRLKTYTGWVAQIIQHEIDHCDGILI